MKYLSEIGFAVVILTHVYMLGFGLPATQMTAHAVLNLVAGVALVYNQYWG